MDNTFLLMILLASEIFLEVKTSDLMTDPRNNAY